MYLKTFNTSMKGALLSVIGLLTSISVADRSLTEIVRQSDFQALERDLYNLKNYSNREGLEATIYGSLLLYQLDSNNAKFRRAHQFVYLEASKEIRKYPDLKCLWGWWLVSVANLVVPPDNTKVLKREKVRTKEGGVIEVEYHEVIGDTSSVKLGKALIKQSLKTRPDGFWERLWAFQTKPTEALSKKLEKMSVENDLGYRWIIWSNLSKNSPDPATRARFTKLRATIPSDTVYGQLVRRKDAKVGR